MKRLVAILSICFLAACSTTKSASVEQDEVAKTFAAPAANQSHVYVFRDEGMGFATPMSVYLDGKLLGKTTGHTYFFVTVDPGEHTVVSKSENSDTITFEAVAGQIHYLWQEVKAGFVMARTKLHLVEEDRGKRGVMRSKLLEVEEEKVAEK